MTKFQYHRGMLWAGIWIQVWGIWQFLHIPGNLNNPIFSWIVSQTGFAYVGTWDMAKDLEKREVTDDE